MLASTRCCRGRMQASAPANAAVAKGCRHPCVDSDLAACRHGAGTRRAVSGYAPADTGGAGTAGTHSCILAAHRVQCAAHTGGLPAGGSRGPAACCTLIMILSRCHEYACAASHIQSAVDIHVVAGNVIGKVAGIEQYCIGDIVRRAVTPRRNIGLGVDLGPRKGLAHGR